MRDGPAGRGTRSGWGAPSGRLGPSEQEAFNKSFHLNKKIMKKYVCDVCGWVYDPEVGDPDGGIAPGTAFEDIPEDWVCPECGVTKEDFSVVEE